MADTRRHEPHESIVERNRAEAKMFEALARREAAEARRAAADAALASAETRKEVAYAEQEEIALRKDIREEKDELAKDTHFKVYVFDQGVSDSTVKACVNKLTAWSRQTVDSEEGPCKIELQINSPGGDIVAGLALVDFLRSLRKLGHVIDTVAFGMAASMGSVILQAGTRRIMGKNAMLLLHEGSLGAIGDFGQVEDRVKLMEKFHERILDIFVERASALNKKTTKKYITEHWKRTDWWLNASESLEMGFVDEVR